MFVSGQRRLRVQGLRFYAEQLRADRPVNHLAFRGRTIKLTKIKPIVIHRHRDGRKTIEVYADRKIRRGYTFAEGFTGGYRADRDGWPVLWRAGVSLTDEEWKAAPGPDWKSETLGA